MSATDKTVPPKEFDENPEWTEGEFARATVIRDGREVGRELDRLRRALAAIIAAADKQDVEACRRLAREALD